jgi:hypothetical protein
LYNFFRLSLKADVALSQLEGNDEKRIECKQQGKEGLNRNQAGSSGYSQALVSSFIASFTA